MARFLKAGARVCRHSRKTPRGKGMSYGPACGVLMEDARIGSDAGWDVYDIKLNSGRESSAYGFDLYPAPRKRRSAC